MQSSSAHTDRVAHCCPASAPSVPKFRSPKNEPGASRPRVVPLTVTLHVPSMMKYLKTRFGPPLSNSNLHFEMKHCSMWRGRLSGNEAVGIRGFPQYIASDLLPSRKIWSPAVYMIGSSAAQISDWVSPSRCLKIGTVETCARCVLLSGKSDNKS